MGDDFDDRMEHQLDYYRERAPEYDDWALRSGTFDRGPEYNAQWFAEIERLEHELDRFAPAGRVLELACGTGQWTERLAAITSDITAVDAAHEVIEQNRLRKLKGVRYVQADLFAWEPDGAYDAIFFSFWLSHVPPERFEDFWRLVESALAPGGRVFFIDNLPSGTADQLDEREWIDGETVRRRLSDGREFQIWKVLYRPDQLEEELAKLGWEAAVATTGEFFLYGEASRRHP